MERVVDIKYMKGKDIDGVIRINQGIKPNDIVKRVVTENSPRNVRYCKSEGRVIDFIREFRGTKIYE